MTGDGLVQNQRSDFIFRTRLRFVGVDVEISGPRAVGRRSVRVGGRHPRSNFRRHRLDSVWQAGESAKQFHQQRIDFLGAGSGVFQQLVCVLRIELRVGAQEMEELLRAFL